MGTLSAEERVWLPLVGDAPGVPGVKGEVLSSSSAPPPAYLE